MRWLSVERGERDEDEPGYVERDPGVVESVPTAAQAGAIPPDLRGPRPSEGRGGASVRASA